jgi:hypothetical protein
MEYVMAIALISHVYAIGYMTRKFELRVYRLSVLLLLALILLCLCVALFGSAADMRLIGRIASEFLHAVWLQSLICAVVSTRLALKSENWNYLSHTVLYLSLFVVIVLLKTLAS